MRWHSCLPLESVVSVCQIWQCGAAGNDPSTERGKEEIWLLLLLRRGEEGKEEERKAEENNEQRQPTCFPSSSLLARQLFQAAV